MMFSLMILVITFIGCSKSMKIIGEDLSSSTLDLILQAQCEARCYNNATEIGLCIDGCLNLPQTQTLNISGRPVMTFWEATLNKTLLIGKYWTLVRCLLPPYRILCFVASPKRHHGPRLAYSLALVVSYLESDLQSTKAVKMIFVITIKEVPRSVLSISGPTAPEMHCREATLLYIKWRFLGDAVFLLEMQEKHNPSWILAVKKPIVKKLAIIYGLKDDTAYRLRVRAIVADGQLGEANISGWISTLSKKFQPEPVSNISFEGFSTEPPSTMLKMLVSWKPAEDRTCFYEAVCWDTSVKPTSGIAFYPIQHHITKPETFSYVLSNLKFGTNYSISIMGISKDETRESTKTWLNITTIKCLDFYNNNLTKCVPPKPYNVTVSERYYGVSNLTNLYNVTVSWSTPEIIPLRHEVELARLDPESSSLALQNTSGNTTWVMFTAMDVGYQYEVNVKAVSPAGSSEVAKVTRNVNPTNPTSITKNNDRNYMNTDAVDPYDKSTYLWAIIVILPILLSIVGAIMFYKWHQRRKRIRHERRGQYIETRDRKPSLRYSGSVECDLDYNAEWEIPRENLLLGDVLGEGAFGIVRKGVLQEGDSWRDVAVKMLRDEPSTEDLRQFKQEIIVMQSVGRHPHIVSLIGCCTRSGRLRLVVEYCAEGDLLNFLRKHWNDLTASQDRPRSTNMNVRLSESQTIEYAVLLSQESTVAEDSAQQAKKPLTPADLLSFARQIAIGMEHLANNRVVHRDLAARNVLVCSDRTVKISDFGLSRDIYEENVYRKTGSGRLPIKWMALESLMHQVYTTQSDVWSFGILLWEIVTLGGNPYPGIPTNKLFDLLKDGYRKECPSNCKQELYDIMLACWQAKPRDRPTFTELCKMLDNLLETSSPQKYLNLNLINFRSEIKPFSHKANQSRSSGGYLNSDAAPANTSETFVPISPVPNETIHHYLNTPKCSEIVPL